MLAPEVGQKVNVIECHAPAFDRDGKYVGLVPVWQVGKFHGRYDGYKCEPSWTFIGEDGRAFSTRVGATWESVE